MITLYQGDLYAGIYSDWCLVERERLAQRHLQALDKLMQCHIGRNDFEMAIEVGQSILSIDPLHEEVHRNLIFSYGRLSRRSEAAAQFQLCADRLMLELKVFPMPETVRVYQQVMTTSMGKSLPDSNRVLIERANRANAAFQRAGSNLLQILAEIENMNFSTGD